MKQNLEKGLLEAEETVVELQGEGSRALAILRKSENLLIAKPAICFLELSPAKAIYTHQSYSKVSNRH